MALEHIFRKLDQWIDGKNAEALHNGLLSIPKSEFRVVGQTALMEARLDFEVVATADVDAVSNATYVVLAKFNELLKVEALEYDQLSSEIWMPEETTYVDIYRGKWVTALRAEVPFIMVSKAKMAMSKNKMLLRQYIASNPAKIFFDLCQKHRVNIGDILRD